MSKYPNDLTTSAWVDCLQQLGSWPERIACLATFHRRVEYAAKVAVLSTMTDADDGEAVVKYAKKCLKALPEPVDYVES